MEIYIRLKGSSQSINTHCKSIKEVVKLFDEKMIANWWEEQP